MDEITELKNRIAALEQEKVILTKQLELKDRHLQLILQHVPITITAFNRDGNLEMGVGAGFKLYSEEIDTPRLINALFSLSYEQFSEVFPGVMQAVDIAFTEKCVTRAEISSSQGYLFHTVLVPYFNKDKEVEYVYSLGMRWPIPEEIDTKYFFKGSVNIEKLRNLGIVPNRQI